MHKPIIGMPLDSEDGGGYSTSPWYALRKNYFTTLSNHHASPVGLPHHFDSIDHYAEFLDGLLITGGGFDIHPSYYGQTDIHPTVKTKKERTEFEFKLTEKFLTTGKPILGICGGQQLLTVLLGGSLVQHIPDQVEDPLSHKQKPPYNLPCHEVNITPNSLLRKIVGRDKIGVNSDHHQSTKSVSSRGLINAVSPDGVIEGVEAVDHKFCLGVVWHPEHLVSDADDKILKAFVDACRK